MPPPDRDLRPRPYGMRRLSHAYGLTVLAAVLGLPVVAAGLILSNSCQLHGLDCSGRLAFGIVGGIVLAAGVQLLLALHFRLGLAFWCCSALVMLTAAAQSALPLILVIVVVSPGLAAWITDPPNRRARVRAHWARRSAAFAVVAVALPLLGLLF